MASHLNDDILPPGAVIDEKYRIIGKLGEGGMGIVYHAEHVLMKKHVALKRLHPHLSAIEQIVQRFEREAQAAARIDHPSVCMVTDCGRDEAGGFFIVMELLKGTSLQDELEHEGPLQFERILRIAIQICSALERAHSMGIVHRDLKPDNIMLVDREGQTDHVKIMDFGIAKMITDETPGHNLTQAGMIFGTPHYLSPEQASGDPVDHRGDLYSLGVILFELSTGRRPYEAATAAALLRKHVTEEPPLLVEAAPNRAFPAGFQKVVSRLMAKNPEDRYPSAKVCGDHLKAMLEMPTSSVQDNRITAADISRPSEMEPLLTCDAPDAIQVLPAEAEYVSIGSGSNIETSAEQNLSRLWHGGGWARWAILGVGLMGIMGVVVLVLALALVRPGRQELQAGEERSAEKTLLLLEQQRAEVSDDPAVKEALTMSVEGRSVEAIKLLDSLTSNSDLSGSPHIHYHLAVLRSNEGMVSEAIDSAQRCMELESGYAEEPILVAILVQGLHDRDLSRKASKVMMAHGSGTLAARLSVIAREEASARTRKQALDVLEKGNMMHHLEPWMRAAAKLVDPATTVPCEKREQLLVELTSTGDSRALPTLALLKDEKGFVDAMGTCWPSLEGEWQKAVETLGERKTPAEPH